MVSDDGAFEIEFSEGGVPGVLLPTVTAIKGHLSPTALSYFNVLRRNASSDEVQRVFLNAVKLRWEKVGRRGEVVVKTTDFINRGKAAHNSPML